MGELAGLPLSPLREDRYWLELLLLPGHVRELLLQLFDQIPAQLSQLRLPYMEPVPTHPQGPSALTAELMFPMSWGGLGEAVWL